MVWRPLTLCSLNYVAKTVQVTEGSMLASPALVDGYGSAEGAASILAALVFGIAPQHTVILMDSLEYEH